MSLINILLAIASSMLINNVILMQFLGICPFLGVSKKVESSVGMSVAVVFVLLLASAISFPIYMLLEECEIAYMSTLTFILVIAALVQLVEMIIKKFSAGLYKSLGVYLPLITTNCVILGVVEGFVPKNSFGETMIMTLGTGLGFALVMFLFSAMRSKLDSSDIPAPFKGVPIALITAGLMALAFSGLGGMITCPF